MKNKLYCVLRGRCRGEFFDAQLELNREILMVQMKAYKKADIHGANEIIESLTESCEGRWDEDIKTLLFDCYFIASSDVDYVGTNLQNIVDKKSFILEEEEFSVSYSSISMDDAKARFFDYFVENS